MTDIAAHICGGYYLLKATERPQYVSDPVPQSIVTLSSCFNETAPGDWALAGYNYTNSERAEEAAKFGIPEAVVPELVSIFSRDTGSFHSNAFVSLSTAEAFYRHCTNRETILLVGIGLHP